MNHYVSCAAKDGYSALMYSAWRGGEGAVRLLLQAKADPNTLNNVSTHTHRICMRYLLSPFLVCFYKIFTFCNQMEASKAPVKSVV